MNHTRRKRLRAAGWRIGSAAEFLKLRGGEAARVERRLFRAAGINDRGLARRLHKQALSRLAEANTRLRQQEKELRAEGLSVAAIKRVLDPLRCFRDQLAEEAEICDRLAHGDVGELQNLHGLGRMLINLRIVRGLTQRGLAERLGIHETQVVRDERNDYHGVTVERASRILDALEADLRTIVRRTPARASGRTSRRRLR